MFDLYEISEEGNYMQNFNENIERLIKETFSNQFMGELENPTLIFTKSECRKGRAFSKKFNNSVSSKIIDLDKPIYRKAFLYGCYSFYCQLNDGYEWLIIGFGETLGTKTRIDKFYMQKGGTSEVNIPSNITSSMIKTTSNSDFIFVHNHPPKPVRLLKNFIIGDTPIASTKDRNIAWQHKLETVFGLLGKRRFYLIENNQVKEFYLPSLDSIMASIKRLMA